MRSLIVRVLTFLAIAHLLPGFHVAGLGTAVLMAIVYSIVSWLAAVFVGIGLVAVAAAMLATAPALALLALILVPLIFFLLEFLVAMLALSMTSGLLPGFEVTGTGTVIVASIILGIVSALTAPGPAATGHGQGHGRGTVIEIHKV